MILYSKKRESVHLVISRKDNPMTMKKIVTVVFLIAVSAASAQNGKLKKADNYYDRVSYAEAEALYTELIGSAADSPEMRSKLANCYYQIGNTKKSEEVYETVVNAEKVNPIDLYNYAQSLKENGKYTESDTWMTQFNAATNTDSRAREFAASTAYLKEIEAQETYFSIEHLALNTSANEFGGYPMSADKAYFVSNRKKRIAVQHYHTYNNETFLDFFSATASGGVLKDPVYEGGRQNKKYHEGPLCFTMDGKKVYFTRNNMSTGKNRRDATGIQNLKIYVATVGAYGEWTNEQELSINSQNYSVGHPTLSSDGKIMYFSSDMPGGFGGADIYKVTIAEDGTLGTPENLGPEVNTEGQEMFPWIASEGWLFFASDGHVGLGGLDVFVMLPDANGSFQKRMNLGKPVNSSKDDFALVMNSDNRTGFVSSNRETGAGGDDIYSFVLLREFKVNILVNGIVADLRSGAILPGATVNLLDAEGKVTSTVMADENGRYEFNLEPEMDYTIAAQNADYFDNSVVVSTKALDAKVQSIEKNVDLKKDPGLSLLALVTDAKTNAPLEGVVLKVVDNMSGEEERVKTTATGDFRKALADKKLGDRGSYNFTISKEGYLTKIVTYNVAFDKEGQYDVHKALDLTLDPEVKDLRDLVQINPINFDLGKYNIRDDAKLELDKIVEVMNKYPNMVVELGAHTDCRASESFNMRLSDKRAKSSADYIKTKITNPERIYGKGYGESQLLNNCACEGSLTSDCSDEEHEKNRRTEFKVISVGDPNVDVKQ